MITSHQNSLVKRIKRLRQKKYRRQEGAYFAEGLRAVLTAVEQSAPVELFVYSPELLTSQNAQEMLIEQEAAGTRCVPVSAEVFSAFSARENPTGLGAIVTVRQQSLATWLVQPGDLFIALVEVGDPGNLGTILRTADAAGAAGLILIGPGVDPYHPAAVKASMGSLFALPLGQVDDLSEFFRWARARELQIIATSARARQSFWQADYRRPAVLLMGSEKRGLLPETVAAADLAVTIPMSGSATSLNLAVATALLLYELKRDASSGF